MPNVVLVDPYQVMRIHLSYTIYLSIYNHPYISMVPIAWLFQSVPYGRYSELGFFEFHQLLLQSCQHAFVLLHLLLDFFSQMKT
jgi:hypothetical protein